MFFPGLGIVMVCIFGAYIVHGGNILIILYAAPFELIMILGSGIGAFVIANSKKVLSECTGAFKEMLAGPKYTKEDYLEILSLQYMLFKLIKSKGMLVLEAHIESPSDSALFRNFPKILKDHHTIEFICDYLRMMSLGSLNPGQMEDIMNEEIETHHKERHQISSAFQVLADGLPALGIVAAVLGVINTMASIDQPPAVLGKMIGSALVGTFMGVFLAYGIFGPMASNLAVLYNEDGKYFECIKTGLIAFLNGFAPSVSVEFSRKTLMSHVRPSFLELEERTATLPRL